MSDLFVYDIDGPREREISAELAGNLRAPIRYFPMRPICQNCFPGDPCAECAPAPPAPQPSSWRRLFRRSHP